MRPTALIALPFLALAATSFHAASPAPSPRQSQLPDCCSAHVGPGCEDAVCSACVCLIDPVCCDVVWDDFCAEEANLECADSCPCETADCCLAHGAPGCDQVDCQSCVCALDAVCCSAVWDETCVEEARAECDPRCACDVAGEGDCCAPHAPPGCEVSACETCVCAVDDFCCSREWDGRCVEIAMQEGECADACSCVPGSNCCFGRSQPGCEEPACEECVCAIDEVCCLTLWDGRCADIAQTPDECAPSCSCGESGTPTPTPSAAATATQTGEPSVTPTSTPTHTGTSTPTSSPSLTPTPTGTASATPTPSPTDTATPTSTETATPTVTETANPSATPTVEPSSTATVRPTPTRSPCTGDCDASGQVSLAEIVTAVNVALGVLGPERCRALDAGRDGTVTIDELIAAVANALTRCGTVAAGQR